MGRNYEPASYFGRIGEALKNLPATGQSLEKAVEDSLKYAGDILVIEQIGDREP